MKTFKYTDATNTIVHVIDEDGISRSSMLVSALPEGTEILPADTIPEPVPTIVTMRQARLALLQFGVLTSVNNAIVAGTEADKITWEYATEVNRNDALVQNLSLSLGLTEQDLDNLFLLANSL